MASSAGKKAAEPRAAEARNEDGDGAPVVIKKYANRRLYNTAKSCYVTLDDLARMVREGEDFVVYDAKTGEDITRTVLAQIIFEEETKGQSLLPMSFLRQLIGLYGDTLQGLVPGYLEATMKAFAENQERLRQLFGAPGAMAGFEALTRHNMELFEQAMRMFAPFPGAAPGRRPAEGRGRERGEERQSGGAAQATERGGERESSATAELDELRRQLREMQERLDRLSGGKS